MSCLLLRIFLFYLKTVLPLNVPTGGGNQEVHMPAQIPVNRSVDQPKTANRELLSDWKIPTFVSQHISPEVRYSLISCKYILLTVVSQRNVAHDNNKLRMRIYLLICLGIPFRSNCVRSNNYIFFKNKIVLRFHGFFFPRKSVLRPLTQDKLLVSQSYYPLHQSNFHRDKPCKLCARPQTALQTTMQIGIITE